MGAHVGKEKQRTGAMRRTTGLEVSEEKEVWFVLGSLLPA